MRCFLLFSSTASCVVFFSRISSSSSSISLVSASSIISGTYFSSVLMVCSPICVTCMLFSCTYPLLNRFSMMSARVAFVPSPLFSSSLMMLLGVYLLGGWVSLLIISQFFTVSVCPWLSLGISSSLCFTCSA